MKRTLLTLIAIAALSGIVAVIAYSLSQQHASASDTPPSDQWEYLVVAGGTTNLTPSDNATMRKAPGAFNREAFPLEQNMDKLGAKGWELVAVSGPPGDPSFYFKRRK
jgi:hypothetical protein